MSKTTKSLARRFYEANKAGLITRSHDAIANGYMSRTKDPVVSEYAGNYGFGFIIEDSFGDSCRFHYIEYWLWKNPPFFITAELLDRGWTKTLIKKYLPKPMGQSIRKHYWRKDDVFEAEKVKEVGQKIMWKTLSKP